MEKEKKKEKMAKNDGQAAGASGRNTFIWSTPHFDKNFQGRFFVNRVVDYLVDAGLSLNDFWYDVKENAITSPLRCSSRIRNAEFCRTAIVFLLWPRNKAAEFSHQPFLLPSVAELAELSILAARSMPLMTFGDEMRKTVTSSSNRSYSASTTTTTTPLKLFVICQDYRNNSLDVASSSSSVLPTSLFHALTNSQRNSVIRLPANSLERSTTTSLLKEVAASVAGELIALGMSELCRSPATVPSRAAWTAASSLSQRKPGTTLEVKLPSSADENSTSEEIEEAVENKDWKSVVAYNWSPGMVDSFLSDMQIPEFIRMRVEELALDGSELTAMDAGDFASHVLLNANTESCRLLYKKVQQYYTKDELHVAAASFDYSNGTRRLQSHVYLIFDPRDAKLAQLFKRCLELLSFVVHQHGQLGRSRAEYAQTQLPKMMNAAYFIVILTETAMFSPFVWEEVCILRSIIQPPTSSVIALSWNIGANFLGNIPSAEDQMRQTNNGQKRAGAGWNPNEDLALPSLLLMLADVPNVPLLIRTSMPMALTKIARVVESAFRVPPSGVVFASTDSQNFDDIITPNAVSNQSVALGPALLSANHRNCIGNGTTVNRYGFLISHFLIPQDDESSFSQAFLNTKLSLLHAIYITPPVDIAILCDWVDASVSATPLLNCLRNAGLNCYADFENPLALNGSSSEPLPRARIRLLLLTTVSGSLRPSHPLLRTAISESPTSPMLLVLCSQSPVTGTDEIAPTPTMPSKTFNNYDGTQQSAIQRAGEYFRALSPDGTSQASHLSYPSAVMLDMCDRGISRFVAAMCRFLGHKRRK